jgi:hypothetical protein
LGPLTCACVCQLAGLRNLLFYSFPWRGKPRLRVQCALLPGAEQTVGALLTTPARANWTMAAVQFVGGTPLQSAVSPPPGTGSWFRLEREDTGGGRRGPPLGQDWQAEFSSFPRAKGTRQPATMKPPPRLLPLSECPGRCGSLGACVHTPAGAGRCECFPPARAAAAGCAPPPAAIMPIPRGEGPIPRGDGPLPTGRGAAQARRQRDVSRSGLASLFLCPGGCAGVGACDGEGFCRCPHGRWGLDCALGFGGDGLPAVLSIAEGAGSAGTSIDGAGMSEAGTGGRRGGGHEVGGASPWPRVYVHDLPPIFRTGRQSFDVEVPRVPRIGRSQIVA